jgi:hypothetical protein
MNIRLQNWCIDTKLTLPLDENTGLEFLKTSE